MNREPIVTCEPLAFPWQTVDPFLFCVHHVDAYPRGNAHFGPDASLAGRSLGQDFSGRDGWNMYHGTAVPGFPAHPHRGFETVTIVRSGLVDHSDSLGARARFGRGDVQWLTAGSGIVHAEMMPLLARDRPNPLELFQIWLNLPARSKMVAPHFKMLWADALRPRRAVDGAGRATDLLCVAGSLLPDDGPRPPAPPPDSWAADPAAAVVIATLRMAPGAQWRLPAAGDDRARRCLYYFAGAGVTVAGRALAQPAMLELRAGQAVEIVNGAAPAEFLLLQGCPIGEPVVAHGPFVMNTSAEIAATFADYRRTGFGGWPWPDDGPVHGADPARFARHPDGRIERPGPDLPAAALAER